MTEQTDAAEVETLRADLANAECACGHQAEWHSALLGCNAEDWDQPACDCRGDWLDAVLPLIAAREAAAEARGAQAVLAAVEAVADEWEAEAAEDQAWLNGPRVEVSEAHELPALIRQAGAHVYDLRTAARAAAAAAGGGG